MLFSVNEKSHASSSSGLLLWATISLLLVTLIVVGPTRAEALSRDQIQQLVAQQALETQHVDVALALGVARVMSNFDAEAVGPSQRIGVFQLDPKRLDIDYPYDELFDPYLNIKIALKSLDQLIQANNGDVTLALPKFNGGFALGPWPMSRLVDYPAGIVANVFAARVVFERKLASIVKAGPAEIDPTQYETSSSNVNHPFNETMTHLPRWRKKLVETRFWLDEVARIRREEPGKQPYLAIKG